MITMTSSVIAKLLSGTSILVAICIGFAAMCGVAVCVAHAADDPPQIRYEVTGGSAVAQYLSYQTRDSQRHEANVSLPWSTEFTGYPGEMLVVSAQGPGTITCRILVNGEVMKDATAAGAPARTVCTYYRTGLTSTPPSATDVLPTG